MNRYHITWFIDQKKTKLGGTTIEAKNIIEAIQIVCSQNIVTPIGVTINSENIKYVLEL